MNLLEFFGIRKTREQRFALFAKKACLSRQFIDIEIGDVNPLVLSIAAQLEAQKGLSSSDAVNKARGGIVLACPRCGEYNDSAKDVLFMTGEGGVATAFGATIFGGPTVAALGQGHCPGCGGTSLKATFDLKIAGII